MQHHIYIRSNGATIICTEEQFQDYYRDINAYRRREQRHGRCVCPSNKRLSCDMDCGHCPYVRDGDMLSLDETMKIAPDAEECEYTHLETVPDSPVPFDELLLEAEALQTVLKRIEELMPLAILIGRLRVAGFTENEIEKIVHVNRRTYAYRLKKLRCAIEKEFSEIMQNFFQIEH